MEPKPKPLQEIVTPPLKVARNDYRGAMAAVGREFTLAEASPIERALGDHTSAVAEWCRVLSEQVVLLARVFDQMEAAVQAISDVLDRAFNGVPPVEPPVGEDNG